jgi:F-type H+-transporting ATPase subunit delta
LTASLKNILLHPLIPFAEKNEILKKTAGKIPAEEILNFAGLLIKENRFYLLDSIIEEVEKIMENYLGRVRSDVVSRNPLTDAEVRKLQKILGFLMNKEVIVSQTSSESVIGGVEIKIGDLMIDATVRSKLRALKKKVASD